MKTEIPNLFPIPTIDDSERMERNIERASSKELDSCPCCGLAIKNPKYFINSAYGGSAYPADDKNEYADTWVMGVGSECQKKFPKGYVFVK